MSPFISDTLARKLLRAIERGPLASYVETSELRAQVERAMKPKRIRPRSKKAKTRDSGVYEAVRSRAGGRCEHCYLALSDFNPGEVDHFWGRARSHSVESCWLLCHSCHLNKTNNSPSASVWAVWFLSHCNRCLYIDEAKKARARLQTLEAKGLATPTTEGSTT